MICSILVRFPWRWEWFLSPSRYPSKITSLWFFSTDLLKSQDVLSVPSASYSKEGRGALPDVISLSRTVLIICKFRDPEVQVLLVWRSRLHFHMRHSCFTPFTTGPLFCSSGFVRFLKDEYLLGYAFSSTCLPSSWMPPKCSVPKKVQVRMDQVLMSSQPEGLWTKETG